jgi:hypothetical protein
MYPIPVFYRPTSILTRTREEDGKSPGLQKEENCTPFFPMLRRNEFPLPAKQSTIKRES